ncbi:MAG: secA [Gammaproteobacteria bacterium]|jgi:hypothetical protein|nr:secA [Gammaproteobacteria bacterium]
MLSHPGPKQPKPGQLAHPDLLERVKDKLQKECSKAEEKNNFENIWTQYCLERFKGALQPLLERPILQRIIERHSWLASDAEESNQFLSECHEHFFKEIIKCCWKGHVNVFSVDDNFVDVSQLLSSWICAIDSDWIDNEIQAYPFRLVNVQKLLTNPDNYGSMAQEVEEGRPVTPHYHLNHIDLLRFLHSSSFLKNILSRIILMNYDGLSFLTAPQVQEISFILVNIGDLSSSGRTEWVLLEKRDATTWNVHYPDFSGAQVKSKITEEKSACFLNLNYQPWKIAPSQQDHRIDYPNALWQVNLLMRILPQVSLSVSVPNQPKKPHSENESFLKKVYTSSGDEELSEKQEGSHFSFLENLPSLFLLQYIFEKCQRNNQHRSRIVLLSEEDLPSPYLDSFSLCYGDAQKILNLFSSQAFVIEEDGATFRVKTEMGDIFILALKFINYYSHLTRLKCIASSVFDTHEVKELFRCNPFLLEVIFEQPLTDRKLKPGDPRRRVLEEKRSELEAYVQECVARNLFLHSQAKQFMPAISASMAIRSELWEKEVGRAITFFFIKYGEKFNSDDVVHQITQSRQPGMDKELPSYVKDFLNIAKMRNKGLESFFNYLATHYAKEWEKGHIETLPLLSCTLDLSHITAQDLITHIQRYYSSREEKHPLFHSLSIIFPPQPSKSFMHEKKLMHALVSEEHNILREESVIKIYHAGLHEEEAAKVLADFSLLFGKGSRAISFCGFSSPNVERYSIRGQLRDYQNRTKENNARKKQALLKANTALLYQKALEPGQSEEKHEEKEEHASPASLDLLLPRERPLFFRRRLLDIEQQLEQEHEHEQEMAQERPPKRKARKEQAHYLANLPEYAEDESCLITRDNIEEKIDRHTLSQATQDLLREKGSLAALFSAWVGEEKDEAHVIQKMELTAARKILQYSSQFRMGVVKRHLPAGFSLALSTDEALILCFSQRQEREDLKPDSQWRKKRSPFTFLLAPKKSAVIHYGDFRQFNCLITQEVEGQSQSQMQKTCWHYFATTDADTQIARQHAERDFLAYLKHVGADPLIEPNEPIIFIMQHVDAECALEISKVTLKKMHEDPEFIKKFNDEIKQTWKEMIDKPKTPLGVMREPLLNLKEFLDHLKKWAVVKGVSPQFIDFFFSLGEESEALTLENLKAFGQLSYQYDTSEAKDIKGTVSFLMMADQIYSAFGKAYFSVWRKYFLNISENWTEFLEKEEIDAVLESVEALKGKDECIEAWWSLVETHCIATGHARYSELWNAFNEFLQLIHDVNLDFRKEELIKILKQKDFHAIVFLDRLYSVLVNAGSNAQHILDHLSAIDWRENGFYHASCYGHRYWDPALKLEELYIGADEAIDAAEWPAEMNKAGNDLLAHALRFVNVRLPLSYEDFISFKGFIAQHPLLNSPLLRLLTVCIALGIDTVDNIRIKKAEEIQAQLEPDFIAWLNKNIALEGKLIPHTLRLSLDDLIILNRVIKKLNLIDEINQHSPHDALLFINNCARALDYHLNKKLSEGEERETKEKALERFLVRNKIKQSKWLAACPWLLEEVEGKEWDLSEEDSIKELEILRQQLNSVDLAKSRYFPTYSEIKNISDAIIKLYHEEEKEKGANALSIKKIREDFVRQLLEKGCVITDQMADFRKLQEVDIANATSLIQDYKNTFIYAEQNYVLLKQLLDNHLAIEKEEEKKEEQDDVRKLVELFIRIDNKPYYDELGQVLGLLLQHANKQPPRYYSVAQLVKVLSLLEREEGENKHYPVDMLEEILVSEGNSGLLHSELGQLTSLLCIPIQRSIALIQEMMLSDQKFPDRYKSILIKIAMQEPYDPEYLSAVRASILYLNGQKQVRPKWLTLLSKLAVLREEEKRKYFKELAILPENLEEKNLFDLWQRCQMECIQFLLKENLDFSKKQRLEAILNHNQDEKNVYIRMILIAAGALEVEGMQEDIQQNLGSRDLEQLKLLASYFGAGNKIPIFSLKELLPQTESTPDLIHRFECISQGKQDYSYEAASEQQLKRILKGLKRKGGTDIASKVKRELVGLFFYANTYSQNEALCAESTSIAQLQEKLKLGRASLKACENNPKTKKLKAAELLAYLRAIMLKKLGKWANSTQMLDLLYVATHDDINLLHQISTGEGKSIVSVMACAYFALNGWAIDLFSEKESLSERDHEQFVTFLDAVGIRHVYLTADSPAEAYMGRVDEQGRGAIHFATLGGRILFELKCRWEGKTDALNEPNNRMAFLDECDRLLKELSRFNLAAKSNSPYNMDAWVYQVVYSYYLDTLDPGNPRIPPVPELYARLKEQAKKAPTASQFLVKYISLPQENAQVCNALNQKLLELLNAAHTAYNLRERRDFCIRPDVRILNNASVKIRVANVLLANQIKKGAIYSNLVQQFLHVRLNKEASEKGELPNFFVPPVSRIALSMTAAYHLKNNYKKLTGCSRTMGTEADVTSYEEKYGIDHIIKLVPHQEKRTKKEPTQYCDDKEQQINAIAARIIKSIQTQPILITCEDDIAVKDIADRLIPVLKKWRYNPAEHLIVDTNESGKKENEVVLSVGNIGKVTLSARMGRGTDIKPLSAEGLLVMRTFPSTPDVIKQDHGRQGRNGDAGTCVDIIDYSVVKKEYDSYVKDINHSLRLRLIMELESTHLDDKIKKHTRKTLNDLVHLKKGCPDREKYLRTRSVQRLKDEIKKENYQYIERKNYFISCLSQAFLAVAEKNKEHEDIAQYKENWKDLLKDIDQAWENCLANEGEMNEELYSSFSSQVSQLWHNFRAIYNESPFQPEDFQSLLRRHPSTKPLRILNNKMAKILRWGEERKHRKAALKDRAEFLYDGESKENDEELEAKLNSDEEKQEELGAGEESENGDEEKGEVGEEDHFSVRLYGTYLTNQDLYYRQSDAKTKETLYGKESKDVAELYDLFQDELNRHSQWLISSVEKIYFYHFSCRSILNCHQVVNTPAMVHVQKFLDQAVFQQPPQLSNLVLQKNSFLLNFFIKFFKEYSPDQENRSLFLIEAFTRAVQDTVKNEEDLEKVKYFFENYFIFCKFFLSPLLATTEVDMKYLLSRLCHIPEARYIFEGLEGYLTPNRYEILGSFPSIMVSFITVAFSQRENGFFLPDIQKLSHWDVVLQDALWKFLAEHSSVGAPLVQEEYDIFIQLFSFPMDEEQRANLIDLLKLSRLIRLNYINLLFKPSQKLDKQIINQLLQSQQSFKDFISSRIKDNDNFPLDLPEYHSLFALFENMALARSYLFFNQAKDFDQLDIEALHQIERTFPSWGNQEIFWNILRIRRGSLLKEQFAAFINLFPNDEADQKSCLIHLLNLPPFIRLEDINQFFLPPEKLASQKTVQLFQSVETFKKFLASRKIGDHDFSHENPVHQNLFNLFKSMPLERSQMFFAQAKDFDHFDGETLSTLNRIFSSLENQEIVWNILRKRVSLPMLKKECDIFINLFCDEQDQIQKIYLQDLLELPSFIRLEDINSFFPPPQKLDKRKTLQLLRSVKSFKDFLSTRNIEEDAFSHADAAHQNLLNLFKSMPLERSEIFFEHAKNFASLDEGTLRKINRMFHPMNNRYAAAGRAEEKVDGNLLRTSFEMIDRIITKKENHPTLERVIFYYTTRASLSTDLNEAVRTMLSKIEKFDKTAEDFYSKEYFTDFDEQKDDRRAIARYFIDDLLDPRKKEAWFRGYKKFALNFSKLPEEFDNYNSQQRSLASREHHKKLILMVEEIKAINQPLCESKEEKEEKRGEEKHDMEDKDKKWNEYIEKQKKYYHGLWFSVNSTRRAQAEKLFNGLNERRTFFEKLKVITDMQEEILRSDKQSDEKELPVWKFIWGKRNKKGYSRLLDVSVSMLATLVSQEFLPNFDAFSREEREQLDRIFKNQFEFTFNILKDRLKDKLPPNNILYQLNSPEHREELISELKQIRQDTPTYLHYLFDQLECFDLIYAEQEAVKRAERHMGFQPLSLGEFEAYIPPQ